MKRNSTAFLKEEYKDLEPLKARHLQNVLLTAKK